MILTVTLNASIDKLYLVEKLAPYSVSRVQEVVNTAGGKGLNVSRVAALAGGHVTAMGFVGGYNGQLFQSLITTPGITPAFTQVRGETRCCINVRDRETNQSTEFLEPGNPVSQEELERFLADYQSQLEQAEVVAISGSMPKGVPGDFYATLCRLAKARGKKVIVDSSGSALREALPGGPDLVKPNDEELCQLTGLDTSTVEGCIQAAQSLRALGAGAVAVSRGKDGVLVVSPRGCTRAGRPASRW